jgi:hypothetical protein
MECLSGNTPPPQHIHTLKSPMRLVILLSTSSSMAMSDPLSTIFAMKPRPAHVCAKKDRNSSQEPHSGSTLSSLVSSTLMHSPCEAIVDSYACRGNKHSN